MLPTMLGNDRKRASWSVDQAAWRLGIAVREYREVEAGERWSRICRGSESKEELGGPLGREDHERTPKAASGSRRRRAEWTA